MEKITSSKVIDELIRQGSWRDPQYKIGDIVLYKQDDWDQEKNSVMIISQSKIVSAFAYIESYELDDSVGWFYNTELTGIEEKAEGTIYESDIIKKL